jgi:hypothetical protein
MTNGHKEGGGGWKRKGMARSVENIQYHGERKMGIRKKIVQWCIVLMVFFVFSLGQAVAAGEDYFSDEGQLDVQALQQAMQAGIETAYVNIPDLDDLAGEVQALAEQIMTEVISFAQTKNLNVNQLTQKAAQILAEEAWNAGSEMTGVDADDVLNAATDGITQGANSMGQGQAALDGIQQFTDVKKKSTSQTGFQTDYRNEELASEYREERGAASPAQ